MTRVVPALHDRHASIQLQEAFFAAVEAFDQWGIGEPEPTVDLQDRQVAISSVFGRMRNSDDIVPEKVKLALRSSLPAGSLPLAGTGQVTFSQIAGPLRDICLERLREA